MKVFLSLLKVVLTVFASFSLAFAISSLWGLFLVPIGVGSIGIIHAYGLMLFVGLFTFPGLFSTIAYVSERASEARRELVSWLSPCMIIFVAWLSVGLGHIAAFFM
jgi:hypothetical protein